jgi:branched-chain amino acid transport system substrate-binding protein
MKRTLISMVLLATALLAEQTAAQGMRVIKIGEVNSYSTAGELARPYRNGWQLAVEEINNGGGINGHLLEVVSRDDGGEQRRAAHLAQALISEDKVDVLTGTYRSDIGLAVAAVAAHNKKVFVAAAPLSDAITWDKGNRYTFRLRPSTYMQAAMLVEMAAKLPAKRWAMLAPNYEYGQSAVASFKLLLKARRPDVEFIGEEWPAMGKIDAAKSVQALALAKPDAIFNATFGADLVKFVRESRRRGLFANTKVVSMLAGEPETLAALKAETLKGWIVTGYPVAQIDTPEHNKFVAAYRKKFNEDPGLGSVVGYTAIMAITAAIKKAESTDSEKLVTAIRDLHFATPMGAATFRAIDQQSTMGAYVGTLDVREGKGLMSNWHYADGKNYLPDDAYVRTRRPASAMK